MNREDSPGFRASLEHYERESRALLDALKSGGGEVE